MSLDKQTLIDALKNMPDSSDNATASIEFAKAFEAYFKAATANGTIPVTLTYSTLQPTLLTTMNSNTVLQTLGTSFQTWALTWAFADATFTGAPGTTAAVGAPLDAEMNIICADPASGSIEKIAEKVHIWATGGNIIVTLSNNQTAVTTPGTVA